MKQQTQGTLYLIPTALSPEAMRCLFPEDLEKVRCLQFFIVEHIKAARQSLKQFAMFRPLSQLHYLELNTHIELEEERFTTFLLCHEEVGLLSDVGCPGVADPGAWVVRLAHRLGLQVIPLIGPSSILLALMASGGNGQNFHFNGYFPIKEQAKKQALNKMLQRIKQENETQIFIETPYRNEKLYHYFLQVLPNYLPLTLAIDLTDPKRQWVRRLLISEWRKLPSPFMHPHRQQCVFVLG